MGDEFAVLVTVTGMDEAQCPIALSTRGTLWELPGGFLLRYDEIDPDDLKVTHTLVESRGAGVTVLRAGKVISTIVYAENETFVSDYATPWGQSTLRVYATEVRVRRDGAVGHVRLKYQLNLAGGQSAPGETAVCWLDIRFQPCAS
ncbi:MAG: DUF1934 domain-containing protein [Firmicutes bacterium]|nr:DUF1934 domain-containing protein [Bacillota bacterium]